MLFCKTLEKLMKKHGKIAADLHRECGLNRPYISKMLAGNLVPSTFTTVESISDALGLLPHERTELADAYQYSKFGDDSRQLWAAFRNSYILDYKTEDMHSNDEFVFSSSSGVLITGKKELSDIIYTVMAEEKRSLKLYFGAFEKGIADELGKAFAAVREDIDFKWIMPMNDTTSANIENYSLLTNIFKLLCYRPTTIMRMACDVKTLKNSVMFPFFVLSDSKLVVFNGRLEKGMFFDSQDILTFYREKFDKLMSESEPFAASFGEGMKAMDHIDKLLSSRNTDEQYDYYIIANVPCIVYDVSHSQIMKYATDHVDEKTVIAARFINILQQIDASSRSTTDIFSYYGLVDYLDNEEWYEYGKHLSMSIPIDFRRGMIKHMLDYTNDEKELNSLMIRLPGLNQNAFIGVNFWNNGLMIFMYDFEEKPVLLVIKDQSVTGALLSYIEEMKKCDLIRSKEESAALIMEELEKRM